MTATHEVLTGRQRVRVGIIGLGYWGPNLARVFNEMPEAEVVAICDRRSDALERIGQRYPGSRLELDADTVIGALDIDAVVIATPISTHFELAAAGLAAGKHVFVEKPLADSLADAEELVHRAEDARRLLMPGHTFLYSPPVTSIKRMLDEGVLGRIHFISASRVNLGLHQPDVSVVWDLGPHDFSMLHYWLGEAPVRVSAMCRACIIPGIPDVAFINLEYADGVVAQVELSWLAPSKLRRTAIVGTKRMVVYDDTATEPVRLFDSGVDIPEPQTFGDYQLSYRVGDIISPRMDPVEPLTLEVADFCRSIQNGTTPRSSATVGVEVVRVIDAVERALETGSRVEVRTSDFSPATVGGV